MTREERRQLLRRKQPSQPAAAKPVGIFRTDHPRALDRRELKLKPARSPLPPKIYLPWPHIEPDHTKRSPQWFRAPLPRPDEALEAKAPSGMEIAAAVDKKWAQLKKKKLLLMP